MSWLGLAGLVYDPAAPAAAPKWVALFVAALLLSGGAARRLPPAAACFLAFAAWMVWRSPDFLGWLAAAALLLAALSRPPDQLRPLAGVTAATVGGGAGLFALAQLGTPFIHGGQGNPDWLGLVVAAALPCSLEWAEGRRRRWLIIALEVAALACSRSRTAWLAAAVSLAVLGRRRWILYAAALPMVAVLVWGRDALGGRFFIWRHAAQVAFRHPLLGAGEFSAAFAAVQGETLRALPLAEACRRFVYTPSAHDDYLQVAAEAGLPALLLLVAALALAARQHRRWTAGLATLACIAVAALADRPLAQPPVLLLLSLILAACPSAEAGRAARWRPLICAAGLMLALPSWWASRLVTRSHDEDPHTRGSTLALAERLDPRSGPIAFEVGLAAAERHDLDTAIGRFQSARRRFFQPATEVALGNALLAKGDAARAVEVYVGLLQLQPGSLRARLNLSEALRRLGRDDEAERHWQTARALWPGHVRERD